MVDLIIESNREKMRALQIQKELVDDHKLIPDTEAGRELRYNLKNLIKTLEADKSLNPSRRNELNDLIAVVRDQIKAMRVPFSVRVLNFLDIANDKMLYIFSAENLISIFRQLMDATRRCRSSDLVRSLHFKFVSLLLTKVIRLFSETRNLKQIVSGQLEPWRSGR